MCVTKAGLVYLINLHVTILIWMLVSMATVIQGYRSEQHHRTDLRSCDPEPLKGLGVCYLRSRC